MKESDLRKDVAKLLIVRASGHALDSQRQYPKWELKNCDLKRLLKEGIGGVILFGGTTIELEQRTKTLRAWAEKPLFLCADVEEGLGQRFQGGTWLAPPLAVAQIHRKDPEKAIALAEKYGNCIGSQARLCGLNWVLAPVCDVNINPKNPVINLRAWGEDPLTVSELTCAFNKGLSAQGVLTCAKHFPGHGDTSVDSHLELPTINHDLQRLEEVEFVPFKAIIASGVDTVMSAHVLFPNIDPNQPASLSSKTITKLLRDEIGFDGLLVTDALVMEAIHNFYNDADAAVMAFAAGADLLMMPADPDEAIDAICKALLMGRIPMQRLQETLHRRKKALAKVEGLNPSLFSQEEKMDSLLIECRQDRVLAEDLIRNSMEIHHHVPPGDLSSDNNLVRVDGVLPCPFLNNLSPAVCLPEEAGYRTTLCHEMGIPLWRDDLYEPLVLDRFQGGAFFLQLFVRGNPFRGSLFEKEPWLATIRQLQGLKRLAGLVVYGSPYLWNELNEVLDSTIPSAYSPGQMHEAQIQVLSSLFHFYEAPDFKAHTIHQFTD